MLFCVKSLRCCSNNKNTDNKRPDFKFSLEGLRNMIRYRVWTWYNQVFAVESVEVTFILIGNYFKFWKLVKKMMSAMLVGGRKSLILIFGLSSWNKPLLQFELYKRCTLGQLFCLETPFPKKPLELWWPRTHTN